MKRGDGTRLAYEVRDSPIDGRGVFATRKIAKGEVFAEYAGDRITYEEALLRYDEDAMENAHTFLFNLPYGLYQDGGRGGNDTRFMNHSCEPSCRYARDGWRVFFVAIRDIGKDEELTYDYHLIRRGRLPKGWKERYRCRCGAPSCRGTLLFSKSMREARKKKKKTRTRAVR